MAYVEPGSTSRTIGLVLVILIHIIGIFALKSGLATSMIEMLKQTVVADVIEEVEEDEPDEPPPPPPDFEEPPPPYVPPPEFAIDAPVESSQAIQQVTSQKPVAPPPPPPPKKPEVTVKPQSVKITQATYPPTSRRLGEEGSVMLAVYIKEDGSVQDAKIAKSSGFQRLDDAALREALKKRWKFKPGTVDGKPTAMWYEFLMTFKLTD